MHRIPGARAETIRNRQIEKKTGGANRAPGYKFGISGRKILNIRRRLFTRAKNRTGIMAAEADGISAGEEPAYYIGKGLSETVMENFDAALDVFMQGYRKFPENLEIQFFLIRTTGSAARFRNNRGLMEEIIALWDRFIAAHPDEKFSVSRGTAHAYVERGILKRAIGNNSGAEEDFTRARAMDQDILVPQGT